MKDPKGRDITQPDLLTLAPTAHLVSLEAVSSELGVIQTVAAKFVEDLGLDWLKIGDKLYVSLPYLEVALWWATRPFVFRKRILAQDEPPEALMNRFLTEVKDLSYLYAGLRRSFIQRRLELALRPFARGGARAVENSNMEGSTTSSCPTTNEDAPPTSTMPDDGRVSGEDSDRHEIQRRFRAARRKAARWERKSRYRVDQAGPGQLMGRL